MEDSQVEIPKNINIITLIKHKSIIIIIVVIIIIKTLDIVVIGDRD